MPVMLMILFVAVATAAPQGYGPPPSTSNSYSPPGGSGGRGGGSGGGGGGGGAYGGSGGPVVPILSDNREGPIDGVYSFDFETGDGISRYEQGAPTGPEGAVVQQGGWAFTFPDGTAAEFNFVADENGYRVESPLLPTPPPLPPHAIAQIEKARLEDAQGSSSGGGRGSYSAPSAPAPQYSSPSRPAPARPSSSYGLP